MIRYLLLANWSWPIDGGFRPPAEISGADLSVMCLQPGYSGMANSYSIQRVNTCATRPPVPGMGSRWVAARLSSTRTARHLCPPVRRNAHAAAPR